MKTFDVLDVVHDPDLRSDVDTVRFVLKASRIK